MNIKLLHPINFNIYSPSITLALLAGYIRNEKFKVEILNLHLDLVQKIITENALMFDLLKKNNDFSLIEKSYFDTIKYDKRFESWNEINKELQIFSLPYLSDILLSMSEKLDASDILCFSCTNEFELITSLKCASILKQIKPFITIFGGNYIEYTSSFSDQPLFEICDYLVLNGGTKSFISLLHHLEKKEYPVPSQVLSINSSNLVIDKKDNGIKQTNFIVPAYDLIGFSQYLSANIEMEIYSSQGCSYGHCTFCSSNKTNMDYSPLSLLQIYEQIYILTTSYNINSFQIIDNNFDLHKLKALSALIIDKKIKCQWKATARFYKGMDIDFFHNLRLSGCTLLSLGFESFNNNILKDMRKGFTCSTALQVLQNAKVSNFPIHLYFIIGYPGESERDINETFNSIEKFHDLFDSVYLQFFDENLTSRVFNFREKLSKNIINITEIVNKNIERFSKSIIYDFFCNDNGILITKKIFN